MLPNRLKEKRKQKKISQEFMAKKLGISRQGYGHYETGRNEPDNNTLMKIAEILDCHVGYLLGDTNKSKQANKKLISEDQLYAFSFRLKQGFKKATINILEAADECNVTEEYIQKLMDKPKDLPGVRTLYKLAELINVTPDYLGGFTDDPQGFDSRTPRPQDMKDFLESEEVMLNGRILSEEDKETIQNVLAAVFMDAKKRNKRNK